MGWQRQVGLGMAGHQTVRLPLRVRIPTIAKSLPFPRYGRLDQFDSKKKGCRERNGK
jgi:hypothetical protein